MYIQHVVKRICVNGTRGSLFLRRCNDQRMQRPDFNSLIYVLHRWQGGRRNMDAKLVFVYQCTPLHLCGLPTCMHLQTNMRQQK